MNLKDIVAISGKPGLYKVIKPTRSGLIVESLDEKKIRTMVATTNRLSVLKEISVYVNTIEDAVPLRDIFLNIRSKYGADLDVDVNETVELNSFMADVLPNFDRTRVYPSDIKKIVNWYKILLKFAPEALEEEANEKMNAELVAKAK
ncbi:MAG: DUF5606 domain-containing protein [Flammeovirgaceae bacterium]